MAQKKVQSRGEGKRKEKGGRSLYRQSCKQRKADAEGNDLVNKKSLPEVNGGAKNSVVVLRKTSCSEKSYLKIAKSLREREPRISPGDG